VPDRPGHDRRYAIDPARITGELGWRPSHSFEAGLAVTVAWYIQHSDWCQRVCDQARYGGERLGCAG
jgi:dTDP-glucose 4,6-dehydratase